MRKGAKRLGAVGVALVMLMGACGGDSASTSTAATSTSGGPAATVATGPSELRIALLMNTVIDEPWNGTQAEALTRAQEARPHDLDISVEIFEAINFADAERVVGDLALSGEYDIIYGSSTFEPGMTPWLDQYPDTVFVYAGAGNEPRGGNAYWVDMALFECTYLAGIAAGMMSENDHVAAVAGFPFPALNESVNGFLDGAKSVNPVIKTSVSFIESWFDPVKAQDAATAHVAAGADVLYASSFGTVAGAEQGGAYSIGDYTDQQALSPGSVLTSALARWDGALNQIIDAWWAHEVDGTPFNAPMDRIKKRLAEDGCEIAPFNDSLVSADVSSAVADARARIVSGDLVIEVSDAPPE